jgi:hypothetical protein
MNICGKKSPTSFSCKPLSLFNFNKLQKNIIYMKKKIVSGISGFNGTNITIEGIKRGYRLPEQLEVSKKKMK